MESIMSWVISALSGHVSREMIVFIISMVPILELRGGSVSSICAEHQYYQSTVDSGIIGIIGVLFHPAVITSIFNWLKQNEDLPSHG